MSDILPRLRGGIFLLKEDKFKTAVRKRVINNWYKYNSEGYVK